MASQHKLPSAPRRAKIALALWVVWESGDHDPSSSHSGYTCLWPGLHPSAAPSPASRSVFPLLLGSQPFSRAACLYPLPGHSLVYISSYVSNQLTETPPLRILIEGSNTLIQPQCISQGLCPGGTHFLLMPPPPALNSWNTPEFLTSLPLCCCNS